jgi:hypothetical protein
LFNGERICWFSVRSVLGNNISPLHYISQKHCTKSIAGSLLLDSWQEPIINVKLHPDYVQWRSIVVASLFSHSFLNRLETPTGQISPASPQLLDPKMVPWSAPTHTRWYITHLLNPDVCSKNVALHWRYQSGWVESATRRKHQLAP